MANRQLVSEGEVEMYSSEGVLITCVLPYAVTGLAADIERCLGPSVCRSIGGETLGFIEGLCLKQRAMLWAIRVNDRIMAMLVTDELAYPNGTALRIRLAGGARAAVWVQPFADALKSWAQRTGAVHVEMLGRNGWMKMVEKHCTYKPAKTSMHMLFEVPHG